MPVDRPGDWVGNHGGAYTDIDGMRKQFTTIDHDKKTTIRMPNEPVDFDTAAYRSDLIKRITDKSASVCPSIFQDFTLRGEGRTKIEWNTDMLVDNGVPTIRLRDLAVLVENIVERKITF